MDHRIRADELVDRLGDELRIAGGGGVVKRLTAALLLGSWAVDIWVSPGDVNVGVARKSTCRSIPLGPDPGWRTSGAAARRQEPWLLILLDERMGAAWWAAAK